MFKAGARLQMKYQKQTKRAGSIGVPGNSSKLSCGFGSPGFVLALGAEGSGIGDASGHQNQHRK